MKNLNSLFIIASIFLFISTIAYAVDFESSVSPTSINEDTNMLLNFTINNTDSSVNITQVNISLPNTNFYFINDTNGTSASGTTFSNTSTVLTWTNTTSVGFIENGTVQYFWFNITASQPGTYNFTVTSLDTSGVSNSTNVSITINDTTSPLYSNQAQNTSTPIVGNGVLLSVYWTDNYNLSYAVLSTNETGAWANKTVYSSPLNLSGNTSWSNFTWSNSSVERATVVGWRIYANDTSNNWNVTDIMTFAYKSSNGASCSAASQCYGGYCVHGYCRSSSTYCGDGYCDSGETSSSCPSDCGSSGGGGGSGAVKPNQKILVKITPGVAQIVKFYDKDLEVKQIKIQVKNKVQNVKITITKVDGKPATITKEISGKVYKYMNIDHENINDSDIDTAEIEFEVEKSWLTDNNLDPDSIKLMRYHNDDWEILETEKTSETANYYYYKAKTPGFSYFAIVGNPETATTTTTSIATTTTTTISGTTTTTSISSVEEVAWYKDIKIISIIVGIVILIFFIFKFIV